MHINLVDASLSGCLSHVTNVRRGKGILVYTAARVNH